MNNFTKVATMMAGGLALAALSIVPSYADQAQVFQFRFETSGSIINDCSQDEVQLSGFSHFILIIQGDGARIENRSVHFVGDGLQSGDRYVFQAYETLKLEGGEVARDRFQATLVSLSGGPNLSVIQSFSPDGGFSFETVCHPAA